MTVFTQYFRVVKRILFSPYNYSRWILLWDYTKIICRSVVYHKLRTHSKPVKEAQILGYSVKFFDYIQLLTLYEEIFVFEVYRFSYENPEPVVVDCGSNIGLSILYFKKVCPAAKIIAFEPDPETFELLMENMRSNDVTNVVYHNFALSNFVGAAQLFKSDIPGSPGMSLLSDNHSRQERVSVTLLSRFINEPIDFLKIDVEGSEINILNDLIETRKISQVRQMVIEFHPTRFKEVTQEYIRVLVLNNFTYQLRHAPNDITSDKIYYFVK